VLDNRREIKIKVPFYPDRVIMGVKIRQGVEKTKIYK
jgi:hypothetical protein